MGVVYDVSVQPLGDDSRVAAPFRTSINTGGTGGFDIQSPGPLEELRGTLSERTPTGLPASIPPVVRRLRVRDRATGRIVSTTTETTQEGAFTLFVLPGDATDQVIQVNLDPEGAWREYLEVPRSSAASGLVLIPAVPERVIVQGRSETLCSSDSTCPLESGTPLPFTDLTFASNFPATPAGASPLAWCRIATPPNAPPFPVTCHAERTVPSDASSRFEVSLLPGTYDSFASPGAEQRQSAQVGTSIKPLTVEAPAGGTSAMTAQLSLGVQLSGSVEDLRGRKLASVGVRANALGLDNPNDALGRLSEYNRAIATLTDSTGRFEMSLDLGYCDVVIEPPADSGFPVVYFANRVFDTRGERVERNGLVLPPPLLMRGTIWDSQRDAREGARVIAYGMVRDLRVTPSATRPVRLASAITDSEGRFTLHLPTRLYDGPAADVP
jgi:hypothetical protein